MELACTSQSVRAAFQPWLGATHTTPLVSRPLADTARPCSSNRYIELKQWKCDRRCQNAAVAAQHQGKRSMSWQAALDRDLRQCTSIASLLHLVHQHHNQFNEVNTFTATTCLHKLLRPALNSGKHTQVKAADSTISCASQLLHLLIPLSLQQAGLFSTRHCVAILTAHAWMRPILTRGQQHTGQAQHEPQDVHVDSPPESPYDEPAWHTLCTVLCDQLVAKQGEVKPADLSRAVWAIAKLGHYHEVLMDAASHTLCQSALLCSQQQHRSDNHLFSSSSVNGHTAARQDSQDSTYQFHTAPHVTALCTVTPDTALRPASHAPDTETLLPYEQLCTTANLVWSLGQLLPLQHDRQLQSVPTHLPPAPAPAPTTTACQGASMELLHHVLTQACTVQSAALGPTSWLHQLPVQDTTNMLHGLTQYIRHTARPGAVAWPGVAQQGAVTGAGTGGGDGTAVPGAQQHIRPRELGTALVGVSTWIAQVARSSCGMREAVHAVHGAKVTRGHQAGDAVNVSLPPHILATLAWCASQMSEVYLSITLPDVSSQPTPNAAVSHAQLASDLTGHVNQVASAIVALAEAAVQPSTWDHMSPRDVSQLLGAVALVDQLQARAYDSLDLSSSQDDRLGSEHQRVCGNSAVQLLLSRTVQFLDQHADTCGPQDVCELTFAASHFLSCTPASSRLDSSVEHAVAGTEGVQILHEDIRRCLPALERVAAIHATHMPPDSLIRLIGSLVHVGYVPAALLAVVEARARVAREAIDGVSDTTGRQTEQSPVARLDLVDDVSSVCAAWMCWVAARVHSSTGRWQFSSAFLQQLEEAVSVHVQDMSNQHLAMSLWSLAKLHVPSDSTLTAAAPLLLSRVPPRNSTATGQPGPATPLTPTQLVVSLWSVAKLMAGPQQVMLQSMAPLQLLQQACSVLASDVQQFSGECLAMIAAAYATAQVHPGDGLLRALSRAAILKAPHMTPLSLSVLTWGLSQHRVKHPELMSRLADAMLACLPAPQHNSSVQVPPQPHTIAITQNASQAPRNSSTSVAAAQVVGAAVATGADAAVPAVMPAPIRSGGQAREAGSRLAGMRPEHVMPDVQAGDGADVSAQHLDIVIGMAVSLGKARVHHPVLLDTGLQLFTSLARAQRDHGASGGTQPARHRVSAQQAILLMWAVAAVKHRCSADVLDVLMGCVSAELRRPQPTSRRAAAAGQQPVNVRLLAMLLQALPYVRYQPDPALLAAVCRGLPGKAAALSSHTLCEITWSLASLQCDQCPELLSEMFELLTQRIITDRQELLTLPSMLKLAWGMAFFKLFRRPLFKHAAANVLSSPPTMFLSDANMMRLLIEVKLLCEREGRSEGLWRGMARRWQQRVKLGAPDSLPAAWVMQGYGAAAHSAFSVVIKHLPTLLATDLQLQGARWLVSPQGEMSCCFTCTSSQLAAAVQAGDRLPISPAVTCAYRNLSAFKLGHQSPVAKQGHHRTTKRTVLSIAVVVLGPWHMAVNNEVPDAVNSHALVHMRLLVSKGCLVVCVPLNELVGPNAAQAHTADVLRAYLAYAMKMAEPTPVA